jgi:hypothetical protein
MYDDDDYIPENQRPECTCPHCRTLGWAEQGPDCIWYRRAE